ncbi:hypothetical protein [Endozoicomonas arenosclerae]|uniref:hypothetical protein n=1 Tax=Endozoicomonas arenosclerae TaxID=1633495 RepID=UPI000781A030|nr:hypothetical protein [Endozoicomonas arenosclerae]
MIKQKLTALALILPLTAVTLTGFADEEDQKQEESTKSEMVIDLQNLVAENEDTTTEEESSTEENKRFELLSDRGEAGRK